MTRSRHDFDEFIKTYGLHGRALSALHGVDLARTENGCTQTLRAMSNPSLHKWPRTTQLARSKRESCL